VLYSCGNVKNVLIKRNLLRFMLVGLASVPQAQVGSVIVSIPPQYTFGVCQNGVFREGTYKDTFSLWFLFNVQEDCLRFMPTPFLEFSSLRVTVMGHSVLFAVALLFLTVALGDVINNCGGFVKASKALAR
jgi:hypothetical protein